MRMDVYHRRRVQVSTWTNQRWTHSITQESLLNMQEGGVIELTPVSTDHIRSVDSRCLSCQH